MSKSKWAVQDIHFNSRFECCSQPANSICDFLPSVADSIHHSVSDGEIWNVLGGFRQYKFTIRFGGINKHFVDDTLVLEHAQLLHCVEKLFALLFRYRTGPSVPRAILETLTQETKSHSTHPLDREICNTVGGSSNKG